jgi:hypothetical protein
MLKIFMKRLKLRPNNDQLDVIIRGMKSLDNIDFTHIGPDWNNNESSMGNGGASSQEQQPARCCSVTRYSVRLLVNF